MGDLKEGRQASAPRLAYTYSWFSHEDENGVNLVNIFYFTAAGFRRLREEGLRHIRITVTNATGDRSSGTMCDVDQNNDVFGGPVAVSTDWGTLEILGFWEDPTFKPVNLARIPLSKPREEA